MLSYDERVIFQCPQYEIIDSQSSVKMTDEVQTKAEIIAMFDQIEYQYAWAEICAEYRQMALDERKSGNGCTQPENERASLVNDESMDILMAIHNKVFKYAETNDVHAE